MSVRIGIDFRAAMTQPCGIGRYARELTRGLLSLREDFQLVLYASTRYGNLGDQIPRAIREHPRAHLIERRLPAKALKALAFLPGFQLRTITGPMALLHHTDLTYLPVRGITEIVTVHDLAYEVSAAFHGQDFRREVGQRVRNAVERAAMIIVPSDHTRQDLVQRYGVDPERVRVIPHGVDHVTRAVEETDSSDAQLPSAKVFEHPYALHVGTIEPRKNLVRLLLAFEQVARRQPKVQLVLAGPDGWMTEEFDTALERSPARDRVIRLGAVSDAVLRDLYQRARMMVYPSLYEGFGLPIGEAMVLGVPVITSTRSSTQEVGGDAALLVHPEDERGIADCMERLFEDDALCTTLERRGRERARELTWKNTARATYGVYREVLLGQVEVPMVKVRGA
jgi:glycosyltransferase involved in cell wall biosynthesis